MNRPIYRYEEGQGRRKPINLNLPEELVKLLQNKTSVARLEELDFDPIEGLVLNLKIIEESITRELAKPRPNDKLLAALFSTRARMLETLMPYAYNRVEKLQEKEDDQSREPIRIILDNGKNFNVS